jgi:hypothetical protein
MNGMTNEPGSVQALTLINQKIEGLEERIRELRQIRELLSRNGSSGNAPSDERQTAPQFSPSQLPPKARQLWEWTKAHGPVARKDIKDKSGVSAGTIANYLNAQHGFLLVSRGMWDVVGVNRERLQ